MIRRYQNKGQKTIVSKDIKTTNTINITREDTVTNYYAN